MTFKDFLKYLVRTIVGAVMLTIVAFFLAFTAGLIIKFGVFAFNLAYNLW